MNAIRTSTSTTTAHSGLRGYQWKCLFLPDSTELRMYCGDDYFYARVVGDAIVYQGQRVSPRQLTMAIAGEGRNAWRDLWLLLPGESAWKHSNAQLAHKFERRANHARRADDYLAESCQLD